MKLETIKATNLKGRTFNQKLTAATVFYGGSMGGKTAYLDAIKLALLGRHPELAATNQGTFQLCSGNFLLVNAVTSAGTTLRHEWVKDRNSVKYDGAGGPEIPQVLIDLKTYFGMTERERMEYVAGRVGGDTDLIDRIIGIAVSVKDNDAGKAANMAWHQLRIELTDAAHEEGVGGLDLVTSLIDRCKEQEKLSKAELKRMASTGEGMAVLRPDTAARDCSADIASVEAAQKRCLESKAQDQATEEALTRKGNELKAAQDEAKRASDPSAEAKRDSLNRAIRELEDFIDKTPVNLPEAELTHKNAAQALDFHRNDIASEENRILSWNEKLADLGELKACPYCKCKGKGWRTEIEADYHREITEAKKDLAKLTKKLGALIKTEEQAEINLLNERAKAASVREADARLGAAHQELLKIPSPEVETALKQKAQLIAEQFRSLPIPTAPQNDYLLELGRINQRLECLRTEQRKFVMERAREDTSHKAHQRKLQHEEMVTVFKEAAEELAHIQAEEINKRMGGLMATANKFTTGILRGPLEYRDGEFGYSRANKTGPDQWVGHETFSGTETALAYAALSVALAQESPIKIVIVDELGVMDRITKDKVLRRMLELIADGTIDQFFGADVVPSVIEGLEMVEVK